MYCSTLVESRITYPQVTCLSPRLLISGIVYLDEVDKIASVPHFGGSVSEVHFPFDPY